MSWTKTDMPDLAGRTFVVTGANSGVGLETARALAEKNATVVMACRSLERGEHAVESIREGCPTARVEVMALDLASLASIRSFAAALRAKHPVIDVLVNNAGVMALPRSLTADGFELQLGTNHLGHFALTMLLLPALERAPAPRVVTVASAAHRWGKIRFDDLMGEKSYASWLAYGQAKLANLLFHYELERRLRAAGRKTIAAAAHPGYAATNLQGVGPRMTGSKFGGWLMNAGNRILAQSAAHGAWPSLYAATMPDVQGGEYFGPSHLFELRGSPKRVNSNRRSKNEADAKRLWEVSEQLTGIPFDFAQG